MVNCVRTGMSTRLRLLTLGPDRSGIGSDVASETTAICPTLSLESVLQTGVLERPEPEFPLPLDPPLFPPLFPPLLLLGGGGGGETTLSGLL